MNVQLYGVDLPFVKTANHLGHQLSEECTMDQADVRSATGNNLHNIQKESGFDPKEHRSKARAVILDYYCLFLEH